jgi:NitT/TauT family transport system permease protein
MNLIGGAQQIPGDLKEASRSLGLRGLGYFRYLVLPAMMPSLVTGSITGWGGGWNALIVSEYLDYRGSTMEVFGIGQMLDHAVYGGSAKMTVLALVSLVAVVVLMNRFFWRRAYTRAADRYKVEY